MENTNILISEEENFIIKILEEYPLPIAFEYQQLLIMVAENDYYGMFFQLSHLFEIILRYLTAIDLSILRTHISESSRNNTAQSELESFIRSNLDKPTVNKCIDILKDSGKIYHSMKIPFMPELAQFLNASDGIEKVGVRLLEVIQSYHTLVNREVRGEMPRSRGYYLHSYSEFYPYITQLLSELKFLIGYPLVRLISVNDQSSKKWNAQIFHAAQMIKGKRVVIKELPIHKLEIQAGWDLQIEYLGVYDKHRKIFLSIYPYALFDVCNECLKEKRDPFHDLFIYQKNENHQSIYYGLADTEQISPHIQKVSLNYVIEQMWPSVKGEINFADRLELLRTNLHTDAQQTINILNEKYNADLYVHRKEVEHAFDQFVKSDYPCFLVIGDSGTGKSNLILTLTNQLMNDESIVSLQNCATWDIGAIGSGAGRHLTMQFGLSPNQSFFENIDDLFAHAKIQKNVFILFDAINESADPIRLLKSIETDILLQIDNRNWFKIIITCRTESWKRLQTVLQHERFFFKSETGITHRLRLFTNEELEEAFNNYKWTYELKNELNDLSQELRDLMSYPLMLRLIAEVSAKRYEGKIPPTLSLGDIFEKYDQEKLGDFNEENEPSPERLFIENILNDFIQRKTDRILWSQLEKSDNEQIRRWAQDRWSLKSPYHNLLDLGVLYEVVRGDNDVETRFLYDQYLEFKLSQKLFPEESQIDVATFHQYIKQAQEYPSLYGGLKTFLLTKKTHREMLIEDPFLSQLVVIEDVLVRGLLVDFLLTLYAISEANHLRVFCLLDKLIFNSEQAGHLAVLVAHLLNQNEYILKGMLAPYESVRKQATFFAFSLWQTNPARAKVVYEDISGIVATQFRLINVLILPFRLITNFFFRVLRGQKRTLIPGLESLLDLTILMIPLAYRRPEATRIAGNILQKLINRIPLVAKHLIEIISTPYGKQIILDVLGGGSGSFVAEGGWPGNPDLYQEKYNYWQEKAFRWYTINDSNEYLRELCAKALMNLSPKSGDLNQELGDIIYKLAQIEDRFIYLSIVQVLMSRVESYYEDLYRFAQRLYTGNTHSQYLALRFFTLCTFIALGRSECKPEHIDFANKMILDFLTYDDQGESRVINYPAVVSKKDMQHQIIDFKAIPFLSHFGFGILYEMHGRDNGEFEFIKEFLKRPWPEDKKSIQTEIVIIGLKQAVAFAIALSTPKIGLVLESMMPWIMNYKNLNRYEQNMLADTLAFFRSCFPNEVDLYLADAEAQLKNCVNAYTKPPSLGQIGIVGMQAGIPWMQTHIPKFTHEIQNHLIRFALKKINMDILVHDGGKALINIDMIETITNTLATAGNTK